MPNNKRKRRPTHPRRDLAGGCFARSGIDAGQTGALTRRSRRTISEILNERRPVTTDMAHRLARAFGTSPEMWLGLQQDVDLWDTHLARQKEYDRIKRVPVSKTT